MYPKVEIKLNNIIENAKKVKELCNKNNISLSVVTKVLSDNKEIVKAIVDSGIDKICEARVQNLISYKDLNVEKWLIRIPMECEIHDVVKYADASLNSELDTIVKLNQEAQKQNKVHKIILMYELGDLREGCSKQELEDLLEQALKLNNIEVYGIGVNLSCYGGILPSEKNMKELEDLVIDLEHKFKIKFKVVSGGNSTSYKMLQNGAIPKTINNLRLGESVLFGNIPCYEETIPDLHQDNFILKTQIVELKEKPSIPWGERLDFNSTGEVVTFNDRGIRKRAIVAIGKQDVKTENIKPVDERIIVLHASSDHLILDVENCENEYKVGSVIEFKLDYSGVLSLMTSKYVIKEIQFFT